VVQVAKEAKEVKVKVVKVVQEAKEANGMEMVGTEVKMVAPEVVMEVHSKETPEDLEASLAVVMDHQRTVGVPEAAMVEALEVATVEAPEAALVEALEVATCHLVMVGALKETAATNHTDHKIEESMVLHETVSMLAYFIPILLELKNK